VGIDDRQEALSRKRVHAGPGQASGGALRARARLYALVSGRRRPVGPGIRRPLNPEWAFFGRMIIGLQLRHEPFR
jgi:hypothetical protein